VRKHGGELGVGSTVGEGTTFTVFVPQADKPAEVQARRAPTLRFGTGRVLFMDDDEKICTLTSTMLQGLDYKFDIARNGEEKTIAIVFGPEDGAIGSEYVFNAYTEALQQGYGQLFLFGFAIQAKAQEMLEKLKVPTTYVAVTPDVVMSDLLKTGKTSEIFSITGLPDAKLEPAGKRDDGTPLYRVVVKGLDIFRPDTMETDEISADNLPCWMLDTNYNGMAFYASQVFFPKTSAWDNLQKSLKGQFEDSVWEHLAGTASEPFALGDKKRVAVKVIDDRGNELMVVKGAEGSD